MNSNALPSKHVLNQRYTIKKPIGQGGFGITYMAYDSLLDQEVCVKELFVSGQSIRKEDLTLVTTSLQKPSFGDLVSSFVKEAKKLAKFRHPNIVRVTDVFHANSTAYMVMDYINGDTLSQRIKKGGALNHKKAADLFYMLLDAVEVIHQKKILHRDIKPGNILITKENKLVLIDFGSAREYVDGELITQTAMISKGYAPNEQYTSRALRGPFTDIYSLGATLYFVLTGKAPLEAPARFTEILPSPHELNPKVSEQLSMVVMKAMEVHPGSRFQSIEAFREALQKTAIHEILEEGNHEEVTQIESSIAITKRSWELGKVLHAGFSKVKHSPINYLLVLILLLGLGFGVIQAEKNSLFSLSNDKIDSISIQLPPIVNGDESILDSGRKDLNDTLGKTKPKKQNTPNDLTSEGNQGGKSNFGNSLSKGIIQFGNQQWMVENLEVTYFRNGDPIREVKSDSEWQLAAQSRIPAWCYFDNDPNKGKLYNWFAVNDPRGLAPKGWHVPSDQEWGSLYSYLGGSKPAAQQLKDNAGFNARLMGFRNPNGKFEGRRFTGRWWTSTPFSGQDYAYGQRLKMTSEILSEKFSSGHGFSVRLIKD